MNMWTDGRGEDGAVVVAGKVSFGVLMFVFPIMTVTFQVCWE